MSKSIPLSPKHGVNPSMILCPKCGESHSIALMGRMKNDAEAPRMILGNELCDKCLEKARQDNRVVLLKCKVDGDPTQGITGDSMEMSLEIFPKVFNHPIPAGRMALIDPNVFDDIVKAVEASQE